MTEKPSLPIFRNPESQARYLAAYEAVLAAWPVPYEEQDIPTRFGQAHLVVCGLKDGRPILLLPGNFDSLVEWLPNIAALSAVRRVYALDVIGDIGKSRASRLPASREDHMAWLEEVVDVLALITFDLMGASYGGYLAASLALRCPGRLRGLVLLCPGLPLAPPTLQWVIRGMPMILAPSRWTASWFLKGASAQRRMPETFIRGIAGLRSTQVLRPSFEANELKGLSMPVLLLVGESEILYSAARAVKRARELIPDLQAQIIPGAGHFVGADQPEAVNDCVSDFLNSLNS